ncbi:metal ABC transporter substrate-binding protein [bacterium]|nr:metal ABC transporter substrate-binding protein [bacterium]
MVASLVLVVASCGGNSGSGDVAVERGEASEQRDVVAAFYPLVFVAEQVGGEHVTVRDLTPPGADSHDLELSPRDVVMLQEADLIVYLAGFAAALDQAIQPLASEQVFDVASSARLNHEEGHDEEGHDEEGHDEEGHDEEGHDEEGHDEEHHDEEGHDDEHHDEEGHDEEHHDEEGHDEEHHEHGGIDPHFWLDPMRLADVADATAVRFAELDPDNAESFQQNAASLRVQLEDLDDDFQQGLADCARVDLVTAHRSFGYLANRYGLNQVGIAGLSPDQEPSAGRLAVVADFVQDNQVGVIYYESLVDPGVTQAVANETGAATDVLDPLETLSETADGDDYFQVMRSNLAALRSGLECA